jgi:2-amino-4-hydroxy-6-hydroxymethyldihydropteridine diphosphokinase
VRTVYFSLGSNIGDREQNLRAALELLDSRGVRIVRASPVYETEPVGYSPQRWFLNLAVEGETDLFPMQLLARIGKIERELGRVRGIPNGPRTIDIDILFYGRAIVHSEKLEIPHPRLAERRFVLAPLADLAPDLRHPVTRKTVGEMLAAAPPQSIRKLGSGGADHHSLWSVPFGLRSRETS